MIHHKVRWTKLPSTSNNSCSLFLAMSAIPTLKYSLIMHVLSLFLSNITVLWWKLTCSNTYCMWLRNTYLIQGLYQKYKSGFSVNWSPYIENVSDNFIAVLGLILSALPLETSKKCKIIAFPLILINKLTLYPSRLVAVFRTDNGLPQVLLGYWFKSLISNHILYKVS